MFNKYIAVFILTLLGIGLIVCAIAYPNYIGVILASLTIGIALGGYLAMGVLRDTMYKGIDIGMKGSNSNVIFQPPQSHQIKNVTPDRPPNEVQL